MENLIYQDKSRYDFWLKLLLCVILVVMFASAAVLLTIREFEGALVMFGAVIFDALLFKAILPSRFQIFEDRLRISMGGPFAWNIPLSTIKEARRARGSTALFSISAVRFATSSKYVMEIVRKNGLNVLISPASGDVFVEHLKQAMKTFGAL